MASMNGIHERSSRLSLGCRLFVLGFRVVVHVEPILHHILDDGRRDQVRDAQVTLEQQPDLGTTHCAVIVSVGVSSETETGLYIPSFWIICCMT